MSTLLLPKLFDKPADHFSGVDLKSVFVIQVSLDKLRGAEGQVTVMQREMEAVQPKLVEASKEVDASMSNMEKEQVGIEMRF